MNKKTFFYKVCIVLNICLLAFLLLACSQSESKGGICLSFDDNYINQWEKILPLLDEYESKVTFFVTGVNQLSEQEKIKLKAFDRKGHDIQAHGELHVSMNSFIDSHGWKSYWKEEVKENVIALKRLGLNPKIFAYPFGEKNKLIDLLLLTEFKATRNVLAKHQLEDRIYLVFKKSNERAFWYYSLEIDQRDPFSYDEISKLLDKAKSENLILFVHAHQISDHEDYGISKEGLNRWLSEAAKRNLKFYTYSELLVQ